MRIVLAVIVAMCAVVVAVAGAQIAAQEDPVGEFRVVPSSGPVGTVVTVSGDFDKDITRVRVECGFIDSYDVAFDEAHFLREPSPRFVFEYEIPAEMFLVQRGGLRRETPRDCLFLAEAGHKLLTASVPFTVTEGVAAMPSAGFAPRSDRLPGMPAAVAVLAAGGFALVLLGWRYRQRA